MFSKEIAQSRDLSVESVEKALNDAYIPMEAYVEAGLFTGLKYKFACFRDFEENGVGTRLKKC